MQLSPRARHTITAFVFLALFASCIARLAFLAPTRQLNVDEESGIAEAYDYSALELLIDGPQPELNASPLHYLLDKAWIKVGGPDLHRHHNLDRYFRIPPMLYFTIASCLALLLVLEVTGNLLGFPLALALGATLAIFSRPATFWYGELRCWTGLSASG